jgi:DNA-binding transcriptional ArsR family regulator
MVLDKSPRLDRVFHALAHPARRAILRQLSGKEQNLSELSAPLRMSFPAASKHVRVLERARLVRRRVVGRVHLCRIEAKPLAEANEWLEGYRKVWEGNFERLDELLEVMKAQEKEKGDRTIQGKQR